MNIKENQNFENIDKGFSAIYEAYEKLSRENFIDIERRKTIRNQVELYLKPNDKILEINAGSGIDAEYFARQGYQILATDIASGAEEFVKAKIKKFELTNLTFHKTSFTELKNLGKFNHIFSNYGGLNCTNDLNTIFKQFDALLYPNGFVTLVIMPPYYPWEMATIFKGNKNAFRRLKKNGTEANVENHAVKTYYYTPKQIKNILGKNYLHIKTKNIGTFYPSTHFENFQTYKKIIFRLVKFDNWVNSLPVIKKGIGDYFVCTFQKLN